MLFYLSVILAFEKASLAGLNIGITTAIWSIVPFCVAVTERVFYNVGIKPYHVVGMLFVVVMTILVSLSDLFSSANEEKMLVPDDQESVSVYVAVLFSLIFVAVATSFTMVIKYVNKSIRLKSTDLV